MYESSTSVPSTKIILYDQESENPKDIGHVNFNATTGQIGFIEVKEKYRHNGLAQFMLMNIEKELKKNDVLKSWVVCSRDHFFWSKQWDYIFDASPHKSVTGSGYSKTLLFQD
jgi:predicted acetyltransferase